MAAGTVGYPGSAEVVNMAPPAALIKQGIDSLPCLGDGRQSGTSASPSILNMSPEAAVGGGLALLKTNDRLRVDLNARPVNLLVDEAEMARRQASCKPNIPRLANPLAGALPATGWATVHRRLPGAGDLASAGHRPQRRAAAFPLIQPLLQRVSSMSQTSAATTLSDLNVLAQDLGSRHMDQSRLDSWHLQGLPSFCSRDGQVYDISARVATVSALLELDDPVSYLRGLAVGSTVDQRG